MKYFSKTYFICMAFSMLCCLIWESFTPVLAQGATVPTILVPKKTITVFKATVSPGNRVKTDGESAQFKDSILPVKIVATGWSWDYSVPSGAGNSPVCVFAPSNAETTVIANSKWYAYPDDPCSAPLQSDYTIKSKVTVSGKEYDAETGILRVTIPSDIGEVSVTLTGSPDVGTHEDGGVFEWYVAGIGTLARTITQPTLNIPQTSQFYAKVVAHENQHAIDYATGIGKDLWRVEDLYPHIQGLSAATNEELQQLIQIAMDTYETSENLKGDALDYQLEANAYAVSDPIGPQYGYMGCF